MRSRDRTKCSLDLVLCAAMLGEGRNWPAEWGGSTKLDEAVERIRYHAIAAQLVAVGAIPESWPAEIQAFIRQEARLRTLWEVQHRAAVTGALERLISTGVDSLVLKGTALAYSVWDDPALRSRGDTDIFVRRDDFETARGVLREMGWSVGERHAYQETWTNSDGAFLHAIDLHWRLRDEVREVPSLAFAACHSRSLPLSRLGSGARMTDYATTLVNCALNHAAHRDFGYAEMPASAVPPIHLGHLADVDRLTRAMTSHDWQMTLQLARGGGIARLAGRSLSLAAEWLGTQVPSSVKGELETIAAGEQRPAGGPLHSTAAPPRGSEFRERFTAAIGWRAKLAILSRRAWPPAREFAESGPAPSGGRLIVARLLRFGRIFRAALREAAR